MHRSRGEDRLRDAEVAPVVRERLAAPEAGQDLESLVEPLGPHPRVGVVAEGGELRFTLRAETRPDDEPAAGENVERSGLARHLPGPPAGERSDEHADPDALRGRRDGSGGDMRVGRGPAGLAIHDVIPQEDAVPAGALGGARELEEQGRIAVVTDVREAHAAAHAPDYPAAKASAPATTVRTTLSSSSRTVRCAGAPSRRAPRS